METEQVRRAEHRGGSTCDCASSLAEVLEHVAHCVQLLWTWDGAQLLGKGWYRVICAALELSIYIP